MLDPEQNNTFEDHYVELPYDLSQVMFVATSNSYNIPAPLLDRMEVISLSGYTEDEKVHIAERHLIPKQMEANGVTDKEVRITDLLNAIRKDVDGTILGAVRRANKNYYYAFVNSAAMNGVTSTTKLVPSMPWWKTAIIVLDAALAVGTAAFAALYAFGVLRRRKGADDTLSGRND